MIKNKLNKLKNAFWYSNPINKKNIEKNRDVFIKMSQNSADDHLQILMNFRSGHMNMVAWMIAFVWLIYTTDLINTDEIKIAFLLFLFFILFSILAILISFYTDVFHLTHNVKQFKKYVAESKKTLEEIQRLDFDKEAWEAYNELAKNIKFKNNKIIKLISNTFYIFAWICLISGLWIICFYFTLDILK